MSEIEYKILEKNPWYHIYKMGPEIWNRFIYSAIDPYHIKKYELEGLSPLNNHEMIGIEKEIEQNTGQHFNAKDMVNLAVIGIDFSNTEWERTHTRHGSSINFSGYIFPGNIFFENCTFNLIASWEGAIFLRDARFLGSKFKVVANFTETIFNSYANFNGCVFSSWSAFTNTAFNKGASFEDSKFLEKAPFFDGAEINGSLNFNNTGWLELRTKSPNYEDILSFAALKREMSQAHMHREEMDFFSKELEYRALIGNSKDRTLISLYREISDFGRSIADPLAWLVTTFILMLCVYWASFFDYPSASGLNKATYLSKSASIPFIPQDKIIAEKMNITNNLSAVKVNALNLLRSIQMVISTVLLFLIGLGIRNRFRIK